MMWNAIQTKLNELGVNTTWLAKETGIHKTTLYNYKNHGVEPTFSKVCKIADALGISLDDLREDKDDEN